MFLLDNGANADAKDKSGRTALYDAGSQGYLRTKVIDNKLYIPDGDPNGYAPGKVYIWSPGNTSPVSSDVTDAVHNFDVVKLNGQLYVSGSNLSGQSTLSRYNSGANIWEPASSGAAACFLVTRSSRTLRAFPTRSRK